MARSHLYTEDQIATSGFNVDWPYAGRPRMLGRACRDHAVYLWLPVSVATGSGAQIYLPGNTAYVCMYVCKNVYVDVWDCE